MCETELVLSYYTDARALLAHGTSYPSRSWKYIVVFQVLAMQSVMR